MGRDMWDGDAQPGDFWEYTLLKIWYLLRQVPGYSNGSVTETGTTAQTGQFSAIEILEAATFSVLTDTGNTGDAMTGFAIPAGTTLYGQFTAFTLTSGKVRAYIR